MKKILKIVLLFIVIVLYSKECDASNAENSLDVDFIAKNIYLGEVYPSGNVYLKAFEVQKDTQTFFAKNISYSALISSNTLESKIASATYIKMLEGIVKSVNPETNILYSDYIPGVEGMDDDHTNCGTGPNYIKNPNFTYSDHKRDFFYNVFDYCGEINDIALYQAKNSQNKAYQIFAFSDNLTIDSIVRHFGEKFRPLTGEEKQSISKQKKSLGSGLES